MSKSTVLTDGYGSFSNKSFVVTLGFGNYGTSPVIMTSPTKSGSKGQYPEWSTGFDNAIKLNNENDLAMLLLLDQI